MQTRKIIPLPRGPTPMTPASLWLWGQGRGTKGRGLGLVEKCGHRWRMCLNQAPSKGERREPGSRAHVTALTATSGKTLGSPSTLAPRRCPCLLSRPCSLMFSGGLAPQDYVLGMLFIDLPLPHPLTSRSSFPPL